MARYARVFSTIWSADGDFRALPQGAQWTYLMLISQPDISHCGVLPLTERRWATLTSDTDADSVRTALAHLVTARFVLIDESTEELWVRSYMKHDRQYTNPNGVKALTNALAEVLSQPLRDAVLDAVRALTEAPAEAPCQAPPEAPDEGDTPPQQPAASNRGHEPAAAAAAPHGLPAAAAAALDIYVSHRLANESAVRSPVRLAASIRQGEIAEAGNALIVLANDGKSPRQIAKMIWHLTDQQIARAS